MATTTSLPPGPRTPAWLQLLRYTPHPTEFLEECAARHGSRFTIKLAGFGEFVMLARPAAIQDVFRGDPAVLHSGEANAFLAATVGPRSVLVLDEDAHAEQRRVLVPPFHGERMRAHIACMRAAAADSLAEWPRDRAFPLEPRLREITLRCILEVVLGVAGADALELRRDLVRMLSYGRVPFALVLSRISPHALLRRVPLLPYYRELMRVESALDRTIARRREAIAAGSARGDVLSDLLRARHGNGAAMEDGEIRDQLLTMLVAGHDTTAVALAWCFLQIVERPALLARLREEIARVTGGAPVAAEHLQKLGLVDAVIRESLRLCTVVPFVTRLTKQPFRADGHDYPAGIHLCPCIHLVHLDPELYPEPRTFRPERFLERRFGPHEWLPFGGGDRTCTGMAFALTQMRVVVATVLAGAALVRPAGARSRRVRRGVLIAPSDGTEVILPR